MAGLERLAVAAAPSGKGMVLEGDALAVAGLGQGEQLAEVQRLSRIDDVRTRLARSVSARQRSAAKSLKWYR